MRHSNRRWHRWQTFGGWPFFVRGSGGTLRLYARGMRLAGLVIGTLLALFGILFTLQGFGAVRGSPMSNTTTWSVLGPVIAVSGLVLAFVSRPRR